MIYPKLFLAIIAVVLAVSILSKPVQSGSSDAIWLTVPKEYRDIMRKNDCAPIENFYHREEVYLPPFARLDFWAGQAVMAAACVKMSRTRKKEYFILLERDTRTLKYFFKGDKKKLEKDKSENLCGGKIHLREYVPLGIEMSGEKHEKRTEPAESSDEFPLLRETRKYLIITDANNRGEGSGFICIDKKWVTWGMH